MQRKKESKDEFPNPGDLFDGFGGFGSHGSMMSSMFGGRDPFDDPFFTRPFGSAFGSSIFGSPDASFPSFPRAGTSSGPVIEELNSDDEGGGQGKNGGVSGVEGDQGLRSNKEPIVEHPDDEEEKSKEVSHRNDHNRGDQAKTKTQSVSFRKVTYGGINGEYYTATTTRKTGSDGVVLEESKQADKTTGEATHRISRGINDKGHTVTRNLRTDGKVDTTQTLHNLNEDELTGFEQAWKGNADRHLPRWSEESSHGTAGPSGMQTQSLALPFAGRAGRAGGSGNENEARTNTTGARRKKVVTVNID